MILWRDKPVREAPPVLDTDYLGRLQKHLGADVTRELMADGMLELSDRMERLPVLAGRAATEDLARLTHDIAGAAGHLGLSALSFHAFAANRVLRGGAAGALDEVIAPMMACREASMDALGRFCKTGVPQVDGPQAEFVPE